jgi:hypothetical protein
MERKKKYSKTGFSWFMRYMGNNLTGREKNSFERELQKDPFAEEAEEGLSSFGHNALKEDMHDLSSRLRRRTSGSRKIVIYRIAASVAVLMTLSTIYILLRRSEEIKPSVETVPVEISRSEPIKAEKEEGVSKEKIVQLNKDEAKITKADQAGASGQTAQNYVRKISPDTIKEEEKISPVEIVTADNLSNISPAAPMARSMTANIASREVGVAGGAYKALEKKDAVNIEYTHPEPVVGKKNFDDYIETNIRRPDILKAGDKAIVVLSFIVRNNGTPDSIQVVRSPGNVFSKEAIRLIMEGPRWKPATENGNPIEEEARVRIVFK